LQFLSSIPTAASTWVRSSVPVMRAPRSRTPRGSSAAARRGWCAPGHRLPIAARWTAGYTPVYFPRPLHRQAFVPENSGRPGARSHREGSLRELPTRSRVARHLFPTDQRGEIGRRDQRSARGCGALDGRYQVVPGRGGATSSHVLGLPTGVTWTTNNLSYRIRGYIDLDLATWGGRACGATPGATNARRARPTTAATTHRPTG
jgi:hypothetical protein